TEAPSPALTPAPDRGVIQVQGYAPQHRTLASRHPRAAEAQAGHFEAFFFLRPWILSARVWVTEGLVDPGTFCRMWVASDMRRNKDWTDSSAGKGSHPPRK
ncbi:unnamed protein product, partial [Ectocarpus sp. 8 AP-2014]